MKKIISSLVILLTFFCCVAQESRTVITDDIKNFWTAFDAVKKTTDSLEQETLIDKLYVQKATPGLRAMMQARRYTAQSYIQAINHYPLFWASIRGNTLKADQYTGELEQGIKKLKKIYPPLKRAKIYFTIGALRSNGTTLDDKVLIGSEIALADRTTDATEFPANFSHLKPYFELNPARNLTFLNIHEYVHTQQKTTIGNSLLAQALIEGAAEFLAELALEKISPNQCIIFGRKNDAPIKESFSKEMFSFNLDNWFWNDTTNVFHERDLGYYAGLAICQKYYELAADKKLAIQEIIELDYNREAALVAFVDRSAYFEKPASVYKTYFEDSRPQVIGIKDLKMVARRLIRALKSSPCTFQRQWIAAAGVSILARWEKNMFYALEK